MVQVLVDLQPRIQWTPVPLTRRECLGDVLNGASIDRFSELNMSMRFIVFSLGFHLIEIEVNYYLAPGMFADIWMPLKRIYRGMRSNFCQGLERRFWIANKWVPIVLGCLWAMFWGREYNVILDERLLSRFLENIASQKDVFQYSFIVGRSYGHNISVQEKKLI